MLTAVKKCERVNTLKYNLELFQRNSGVLICFITVDYFITPLLTRKERTVNKDGSSRRIESRLKAKLLPLAEEFMATIFGTSTARVY